MDNKDILSLEETGVRCSGFLVNKPFSNQRKIMTVKQLQDAFGQYELKRVEIGWQAFYELCIPNHQGINENDIVCQFRVDDNENVDNIEIRPFIEVLLDHSIKTKSSIELCLLSSRQKWLTDKKWSPLIIQRSFKNRDIIIEKIEFNHNVTSCHENINLVVELVENILEDIRYFCAEYDIVKFKQALL